MNNCYYDFVLYTDLDGTLLGEDGSLLKTYSGSFTSKAAESIVALHLAGGRLVIVSGRNELQLFEAARLLSFHDFIAEIGSVIHYDRGREVEFLNKKLIPEEAKKFETLIDFLNFHRIPEKIMESFPGLIEPHEPWGANRKHTFLFRGYASSNQIEDIPGEINLYLKKHGLSWLNLIDNGTVRRKGILKDIDASPRAYHLAPVGISKASAVARHSKRFKGAKLYAMGDSAADLQMTNYVNRFFFHGTIDELKSSYSILVKSFNFTGELSASCENEYYIGNCLITVLNAKGPEGFSKATKIILKELGKQIDGF